MLDTEWTVYRRKPKIVRTQAAPGPAITFPDEDILAMRRPFLHYRQLSIARCTFLCCDIRGDGFIGETFGIPLSLDEDTWGIIFSKLRANPKENDECRVWRAPTRLMHPSLANKFKRLITLALDADALMGYTGLLEILNIRGRLSERLSETIIHGMQVCTILI